MGFRQQNLRHQTALFKSKQLITHFFSAKIAKKPSLMRMLPNSGWRDNIDEMVRGFRNLKNQYQNEAVFVPLERPYDTMRIKIPPNKYVATLENHNI